MKRQKNNWLLIALVFAAGILLGGYLFRDVQPRSFLALDRCKAECLDQRELLGLLGSVGVQVSTDLIPAVVAETENVVVMKHPRPETKTHYVLVPKVDIKDPADATEDDLKVLAEVQALAGELVREYGLKRYRLITNGPGYQHVRYWHMHLMSNEREM